MGVDLFVADHRTKMIHHGQFVTRDCRVEEITELRHYTCLADARRASYRLCAYCFRSEP